MRKLDVWVKKIEAFFSGQAADGFALNWDRERYFSDFEDKFKNFRVINNTDFNYSYCNSFDLRVPESMISGNYIITLKLSFIVNAFVLFVTWYSDDFRKGKVVSINDMPELFELYRSVVGFAESKGFESVESEWLSLPINNVRLDLAENPTLDNCLFDDF